MKKRIFSVLGILILSLNTIFCNAVEISFEDLEIPILLDENLEMEQENILINVQDIEEENIEEPLEAENFYIDNNFYQEEVELEHAISTFNINRINLPTITNYMTFSRTNSVFVDVTNLATGEAVSHDCNLYLAKNFNASEHWSECTICGNKLNVTSHSLSSYWTLGETCNPDNKLRSICDCGYFTESANTRSHGTMSRWSNVGSCGFICSSCYAYTEEIDTAHYNSSGQKLGCTTGRTGTCKICGYSAGTKHESDFNYDAVAQEFVSVRNCFGCDKQLVNIDLSSCTYTQDGKNFTVNFTVYINDNVTSVGTPAFSPSGKGVITSKSTSKNGHYAYINISGYFYDDLEDEIRIHTGINTSYSYIGAYINIHKNWLMEAHGLNRELP